MIVEIEDAKRPVQVGERILAFWKDTIVVTKATTDDVRFKCRHVVVKQLISGESGEEEPPPLPVFEERPPPPARATRTPIKIVEAKPISIIGIDEEKSEPVATDVVVYENSYSKPVEEEPDYNDGIVEPYQWMDKE